MSGKRGIEKRRIRKVKQRIEKRKKKITINTLKGNTCKSCKFYKNMKWAAYCECKLRGSRSEIPAEETCVWYTEAAEVDPVWSWTFNA